MGIMAGTASQTAYVTLQKDREKQLLFAGFAYYNAIRQFHQTNGYYPRSLNDLVKDPNSVHRVYMRDLYSDPMQTHQELGGKTGWRLIRSADGRISGVASRSGKEPLKKVNFPNGFERFENSSSYSEWEFEYAPNRQVKKIQLN
jgi:type II secretory pathway pseudopilin PulG